MIPTQMNPTQMVIPPVKDITNRYENSALERTDMVRRWQSLLSNSSTFFARILQKWNISDIISKNFPSILNFKETCQILADQLFLARFLQAIMLQHFYTWPRMKTKVWNTLENIRNHNDYSEFTNIKG